MTKLILSTSNLINGSPSILRRPAMEKSNVELVNSLRASILSSKQAFAPPLDGEIPSHSVRDCNLNEISYRAWATLEDDTLFLPSLDFSQSGLTERREQYDITAKLFFLRGCPVSERYKQAEEAVSLVLKQLHMPSLDLVIVSFSGISFDTSNDCEDPIIGRTADDSGDSEDLDSMISSWRAIERLQEEGLALRIGIAEFGMDRLKAFLPTTKVRPSVNQISLKDICLVPTPLIGYAKQEKIDLLTHSDCTNILPTGTLREILGTSSKGAGVILDTNESGEGLKGDIKPQWVIKYTAVVRDRGVIADKGYFAMAELNPEGVMV